MRSQKINFGDLIEISASRRNPAYIVKLDNNVPLGSIYTPESIVGIYLGIEFINLSVDWVDRVVFLYDGTRHALINGTFKKRS